MQKSSQFNIFTSGPQLARDCPRYALYIESRLEVKLLSRGSDVTKIDACLHLSSHGQMIFRGQEFLPICLLHSLQNCMTAYYHNEAYITSSSLGSDAMLITYYSTRLFGTSAGAAGSQPCPPSRGILSLASAFVGRFRMSSPAGMVFTTTFCRDQKL